MNMAKDLRTLTFEGLANDATVIASHLFDRAVRIKKMVCQAAVAGTAAIGGGNVTFGKHDSIAVHGRPGDFWAALTNQIYVAAAGGALTVSPAVIDLGDDYVDVEEDDYLHLVIHSNVADAIVYGRVVIYYYDK
jgi:hypothetical protein